MNAMTVQKGLDSITDQEWPLRDSLAAAFCGQGAESSVPRSQKLTENALATGDVASSQFAPRPLAEDSGTGREMIPVQRPIGSSPAYLHMSRGCLPPVQALEPVTAQPQAVVLSFGAMDVRLLPSKPHGPRPVGDRIPREPG